MEKLELSLEMVQGLDRNKIPFTAFVVCNPIEKEKIESTKKGEGPLNLNELTIIFKQIGHNVESKVLEDVKDYFEMYYSQEDETAISTVGDHSPLIESS